MDYQRMWLRLKEKAVKGEIIVTNHNTREDMLLAITNIEIEEQKRNLSRNEQEGTTEKKAGNRPEPEGKQVKMDNIPKIDIYFEKIPASILPICFEPEFIPGLRELLNE